MERGSFTAAATALGLPKSSISRGVAKLEQELGITLFQRTTRTLRLTEGGRAFADRARAALQTLDAAAEDARGADGEPRGDVRLTVPPNLAGVLAELLGRFVSAHPQVRIHVMLTSRMVDLVEEGVDLALRAGQLPDSTLVAQKVAESPWVVCASPAYLAGHPPIKRVADLAAHDCLLYRAPQGSGRWTLRNGKTARTVAVRGPLSSDEVALVAEACVHGAGVALLPAFTAAVRIKAGSLVRVLPKWAAMGAALWLVHPPGRHVPRRVELVRDFLYAELRNPVSSTLSVILDS